MPRESLEDRINYELDNDYNYRNKDAIEEAILNDALMGEHLDALAAAMKSGLLEDVGRAFATAVEEYCARRAEDKAISSLEFY